MQINSALKNILKGNIQKLNLLQQSILSGLSQQDVKSIMQKPSTKNMSYSDKLNLKQQAKQLLLKGCYRMASNKYTRLIQNGIQQFTNRQQATIYLNCGICFQFMVQDNHDNYVKALQNMKNAILADNTYQKTYYRLIQLFRDHGPIQAALAVVPPHIKNKQIDDILKEVRQQFYSQADFTKVLQKNKGKTLNLQNGKALCSKLSQIINNILSKNIDFTVQMTKKPFQNEIQKAGNQINLLYNLIVDKPQNTKKQQQSIETNKSLLKIFYKVIQTLFVSKIQDKKKIPLVDSMTEPMMRVYRENLLKYLNDNFTFNNKQLQLDAESKFQDNNQFITHSDHKSFNQLQLYHIKYTRLIDINLNLFGKTYCYLSNKAYENSKNKIQNKNIKKQDNMVDFKLIHKYLLSNSINFNEVVSFGVKQIKPHIKQCIIYGGHPAYLYKNIKIVDLNFIKQILDEQCKKIQSIYGSSKIDPVYLQTLNDVLISIDSILQIILCMVQIYSYRESQNMKTLVNKLTQINSLNHLIYIYHWEVYAYKSKLSLQNNFNQQINMNQSNKTNSIEQKIIAPIYQFNYKYEQLLNYFEKDNQNFITLYLIQKIIQFSHTKTQNTNNSSNKSNEKSQQTLQSFQPYKQRTIQICIKKTKYIQNKISQTNKQKSLPNHYVYKQMYIILVCMILKLDIKRKIDINSALIFKQVFKDIVSDMALQVLLLILINSPSQLTRYLQNYQDITNLVKGFINKPLLQQLQPFKILLNVIYMLICDFENDQQSYFAKKLGVTQQQVHQVRKLQKQAMDQKQKQRLTKLKTKFKNYIAQQWHDILNKICKIVKNNLKMQTYCSSKLCKIIYSIAQINYIKLYSSSIIQFMLQSRNIKDPSQLNNNIKQTACKFFQIICKKCNVQIFQYKHLQSIVDSLLWLINNCQHQLIYFQSLLGLVNLSTMSVRIPIQEIQKCLFQENSYIMHAGVCVMNNIIIYCEDLQQENQKNIKIKSRISDLVYKDQIITLESQLPQTDYSHPKKIYNSLMSLATVLKLQKLEELQSWEQSVKYIKILSNNKVSNEASQLLFKLAIYHSLEKKLPRGWNKDLQIQLQNLKKIDIQKFQKLAQLI